MAELDIIRDWFAYNAYARRGYIEAFAKLPPGELVRDRGASFPTMLNILEHTLGAYYRWLNRATTDNPTLPRLLPFKDTSENPSLEEIADAERSMQALIDGFLSGLTEKDLDLTLVIPKGRGYDHDRVVSIREMLWHLVEEELQHRGELNALMWQIDADPPIYSWNKWSERKRESKT